MSSINAVCLIGRLVKDPELLRTKTGNYIGNATIAVDDLAMNEKVSYFFDLKFFGKTAEVLSKYSSKGNLIGVSGRLIQEKYVNRQGKNVSTIKVFVQNLQFLEKNNQLASGGDEDDDKSQQDGGTQSIVDNDGDLPF